MTVCSCRTLTERCSNLQLNGTVPSRLRGSISRPNSTVYPTRSETVQNCSEFFHTIYPKMTIPNRFQTKNPEENKKLYQNSFEPCSSPIPQAIQTFLMHSSVIVSNRKLGFLEFSENSGHFWPLLATSGHFWPLLATSGHFWPLLATFSHFWPLLLGV